MNVDLNWCPCGKQSREGSMYCSDACYLKDLSSNGNNDLSKCGKFFGKDSFFNTTMTTHHLHHNEKKNSYLKVPDFKNPYDNFIVSASNNLAFKNRQKYHNGNNYYFKNSYATSKNLNVMASSYTSTTSTIDDYFNRPTLHSKVENSPKQHSVSIAPKKNENAKEKEKSEIKSYSSRSSYVIEAVYPVQNFNKNSITVY